MEPWILTFVSLAWVAALLFGFFQVKAQRQLIESQSRLIEALKLDLEQAKRDAETTSETNF